MRKQFDLNQVVMIVMFCLVSFYLFRKEFNHLFDDTDLFYSQNTGTVTWVVLTFAFGSCCLMGGFFLKIFVIEPWQDRRLQRRFENNRIQVILDTLEKGRPLISLTENAMESFSLMLSHEAYRQKENEG